MKGRALVAAGALLSLVLAFVVPGSFAYAAGMAGFVLLPLLMMQRVGESEAAEQGIRYVTGRSGDQRMDLTVRWLGALAFMLFGYFSHSYDAVVLAVFGALIGNACALMSVRGLYAALFRPDLDAQGVTLEGTTLTVDNGGGVRVIAYAELRSVVVEEKRVVLTTAADRYVVDVHESDGAAAEIARAINEAKASAASRVKADDGRMRELRRPSGMSAREWLSRLDAFSAASRSPGAYRGGSIDEEHLHGVLSDDHADVDSRAAAARVLSSSDDATVRTRVATIVSAIEHEATRVRVKLAMRTDTDEAAAEMEALEMEDLRKRAGVA